MGNILEETRDIENGMQISCLRTSKVTQDIKFKIFKNREFRFLKIHFKECISLNMNIETSSETLFVNLLDNVQWDKI